MPFAYLLSFFNHLNDSLGDISNIGNDTYNSFEKILQYYIDNGYLPDINSVALVPKMTSNTSPSGQVVVSDSSYATNAYKVFDGDTTTATTWYPATNGGTPNTIIGYKFTSAVLCQKAEHTMLAICELHCVPVYSDDGINWIECGNSYIVNTSNTIGKTTITEQNKHQYWGIKVTKVINTSSSSCNSAEIQFYGKA